MSTSFRDILAQGNPTASPSTLQQPRQDEQFDLRHLVETVSSLALSSSSASSAVSTPLSASESWSRPTKILDRALVASPPAREQDNEDPARRASHEDCQDINSPSDSVSDIKKRFFAMSPEAASLETADDSVIVGCPTSAMQCQTTSGDIDDQQSLATQTQVEAASSQNLTSGEQSGQQKQQEANQRKESSWTIAPSTRPALSFFPPVTAPSWPPTHMSLSARKPHYPIPSPLSVPSKDISSPRTGTTSQSPAVGSNLTRPAPLEGQEAIRTEQQRNNMVPSSSIVDQNSELHHGQPRLHAHDLQSGLTKHGAQGEALAAGTVGIGPPGPPEKSVLVNGLGSAPAFGGPGERNVDQKIVPKRSSVAGNYGSYQNIFGSESSLQPSSHVQTPSFCPPSALSTNAAVLQPALTATPLKQLGSMMGASYGGTNGYTPSIDALAKHVPRHTNGLARPPPQTELQQWRSTVQQQAAFSTALHLASFGIGVGPGVNPDVAALRSSSATRMFPQANPPIINTGNLGPMCVQPGDWVCTVCSFVNWRRRKVCMRCFPFAEGNEVSASLASGALIAAQLAAGINPNQTQLDLLTRSRNREASSSSTSSVLSAQGSRPSVHLPPIKNVSAPSSSGSTIASENAHIDPVDEQTPASRSFGPYTPDGLGSGRPGISSGTSSSGLDHVLSQALRLSDNNGTLTRDEGRVFQSWASISPPFVAPSQTDHLHSQPRQQPVPRYASQTSSSTATSSGSVAASIRPGYPLASFPDRASPEGMKGSSKNFTAETRRASQANFGSYFITDQQSAGAVTPKTNFQAAPGGVTSLQDRTSPDTLSAIRDIWLDTDLTSTRRSALGNASNFNDKIGTWSDQAGRGEDDETLVSPQDPTRPRPDPIGTRYGAKKAEEAPIQSSARGMFV